MPSTATTRNRFEKQATGENTNTWGSKLNAAAFDLIDASLDGRTTFTLSGSKLLTSTNFAADEARARFLDISSGTGGTVTIPSVEKLYFVRNATSGTVTITTGGSTNAMIGAGLIQWVVCDGTNVRSDGSAGAAAASAAAAAASAASITDANLVHLTGSETISGVKTFSNGLIINGQTLDGITSLGVTIAEAANAATVRAAISAAASGAAPSSGLTMTAGRILGRTTASTGAIEEISIGSGLSLAAGTLNTASTTTLLSSNTRWFDSTTPASFTSMLSTGAITAGSVRRVTVRGYYTSVSNTQGLGLALAATGTYQIFGTWRIWHSATAFTEGQIRGPSDTLSGANSTSGSVAWTFEVQFVVRAETATTIEIKGFNTTGIPSVATTNNVLMIVEAIL